jgi:LAS superfamily LD-carboxypeptidase LdcB
VWLVGMPSRIWQRLVLLKTKAIPVEPPTGLYGDAFGIHNINERITMTNEQTQELIKLLKDAQRLGLRFDIGTAYIRRSYIDAQTELNAQIDALLKEAAA